MSSFSLTPPISAAPVRLEPAALTDEPAQLPAVVPAQSRSVEAARPVVARRLGMTRVSEIAKYDPALATALHERLDLSKVIEGGARVSVRDAYEVLTPAEFQRFEAVRAGVKEARFPLALAVTGIPAATAALAGAVTALGTIGGEGPSMVASMLGIFGSAFAIVGFPLWGHQAHAAYKQRLAALPALVDTMKLSSAKADAQIKSE